MEGMKRAFIQNTKLVKIPCRSVDGKTTLSPEKVLS